MGNTFKLWQGDRGGEERRDLEGENRLLINEVNWLRGWVQREDDIGREGQCTFRPTGFHN